MFSGSSQNQLAKQRKVAKSHSATELKSKEITHKLRGIYKNDPVLHVIVKNNNIL